MLHNNGKGVLYRLVKALFNGPQQKAISQLHRDEFIAVGRPRDRNRNGGTAERI